MKKNVRITHSVVKIEVDDQFAILSRKPHEGVYSISLSIDATPRMCDILDESSIVEVTDYDKDGIIYFKRLSFYETHLLIDIISDILERHISDLKHDKAYRLL